MATEYGLRLRAARKHANLTQVKLSELTGIAQSTISTAEREGRGSSDTPVYAKVCGVDAHWLATGTGAMLSAPAPEPSNVAPMPAPGDRVVRVPVLANAGSMGVGTDVQHDDILVGQIDLSEQWVAQRIKPSSPSALRFVHAYGDSMSPTFEDGDVLLVDTGMRDPRHIDGVYVMTANDRMYIKRVRQRMDGSVEISSDNATVKTVDVLNGGQSIDVLGRVVWCWNGRKL